MNKIFIIFTLSFLLIANVALAQTCTTDNNEGNAGISNNSPTTITNPLGSGIETPQALIGKVINSVLGIVGSLALVMFVYGGLIWMTSSGSSEQVKKGRDILIWAAIGLVIIFSAYGLVRFVIVGVGA
jgi:hypothetical protein